ncbi:MAG: carbamoyltransferase HypF [Synechococcales cyanobacterium]
MSIGADPKARLCLQLQGSLQGVGFRPLVYRLAQELHLGGWVRNSAAGVQMELEGSPGDLEHFIQRLPQELPVHARLDRLTSDWVEPLGETAFVIAPSTTGVTTAGILPDLATCPQCLQELWDPANRRYRYPFITCTHCGPRYSILTALPYDRIHTTLHDFPLCPDCEREYRDPHDRRFHAQPIACPRCGPQMAFWDAEGQTLAEGDQALGLAADWIRQGQIVALKGLGGFQILVDARCAEGVQRLRQSKHRPHKPFALMYPHLELVRCHCQVSAAEADLLQSAAAPIVLLGRRGDPDYPELLPTTGVAPDLPEWGIMLPYTPLHHLLLGELGIPVVATSGNRRSEPICIDNQEAVQQLRGMVDGFVVHNRPIAHAIDDSVARILAARVQVLRQARGYAPLLWSSQGGSPLLAVGGHHKNTVALDTGQVGILSPHLGDLDTPKAVAQFEHTLADLCHLYDTQPQGIAHDTHPDYRSSQWAAGQTPAKMSIPHHLAHVVAVMAEHHLTGDPPVLGVAWDGSGMGLDGTLWGGEFLVVGQQTWRRVAHLRPFPLPGGEQAVKDPRRSALGLLYALEGEAVFCRTDLPLLTSFHLEERRLLAGMLRGQVNCPPTTSVGRLFDAVMALMQPALPISFEGQAAMMLEARAREADPQPPFDFRLVGHKPVQIDWDPLVQGILANPGSPIERVAAAFHATLVQIILAVAHHTGLTQVVLAGGCFQNRLLSETSIRALTQANLRCFWAEGIPPNDGGLAFGQIMAARRALEVEACV